MDDLRLAGKAKRTVYGFVRAVQKLAEFHQKLPETITEAEVRQFLQHLIVELEVAAGTQTVILSGLKFFYRTTCPCRYLSIGKSVQIDTPDESKHDQDGGTALDSRDVSCLAVLVD